MRKKVQEKEEALRLRRQGYSYRDILEQIPVAKSTLSAWLKDMPLTQAEKVSIKNKRSENVTKGRIRAAATHRQKRIATEKQRYAQAQREFECFSSEPFFHTGIGLYWAEGAKRNSFFAFSNSDPAMVRLMVYWVREYLGVSISDIMARLYVHAPYAHEQLEQFWAQQADIPLENFRKTIYKPTGLLIKKRPNYRGCLRISLKCSKKHLQKMQFWQNMLVEYYKRTR